MHPLRLSVNVDCLTDTHRLSCRVPVGSPGLITVLNDSLHSLLEAEDVYFSRLQQPAKIVSHFEAASLNKTSLALVVVNRREDLGPQGIARGGYSRLEAVPGATVVRVGSSGGVTSLFLRGGNSNYVKVLVDGVPMNQAGGDRCGQRSSWQHS